MTDIIPRGADCFSKKHEARASNRGVCIPQGQSNSTVNEDYFLYELELLEDAKRETWEKDPADPLRTIQMRLKKGTIVKVKSNLVVR